MVLRNTETTYGSVAIGLHWLVVIGVSALIWLGLQQSGMDRGVERQAVRDLHGSIAVVVFLLMSARLVWRIVNPVPAHPVSAAVWQRAAAGLVHWGLYAAVFIQIVAGSMIVATGGRPLPFFGLLEIHLPVAENDARHEFWEEVHEAFWSVIVLLVVVHVAAALYHHFIARDDVLRRITVGGRGG